MAVVAFGAHDAFSQGAKIVPIEGQAFVMERTGSSISDNLNALQGKRVTVTFESGKQYTGTIKSVKGGLLHLEKIEGKEFFDALIRVDSIVAIEARFRKYSNE